eukprot:5562732-Pyramimonas_sp.AAC.1
MAQSQAAAVLIEAINSRVRFVESQRALGVGQDALLETQANALLATIRSTTKLTVSDTTAIGAVLAEGPWSGTQKLNFASCLADASCQIEAQEGTRAQQTCWNIHLYFTAADWDTFKDGNLSIDAKVVCAAKRFYKLGLTCPREKCVAAAVATILVADGNQGDITANKKLHRDKKLKANVKLLEKVNGKHTKWFPHLVMFPGTPQELSPDLFAHAYADGQPVNPPEGAVDTVVAMPAGVRGTHASFRPSGAAPFQAISSGSSGSSGEDMMRGLLCMAAQFFGGNGNQENPDSSNLIKNLKLLNQKPKAKGQLPLQMDSDSQES